MLSDFITKLNKVYDEKKLNRNVIEFCESSWGLGITLIPQQKFILKCFYGLPLSRSNKDIVLHDKFAKRERFRFSEVEFLQYLWDEGRINTKDIEGHTRFQWVLIMGRRGTKSTTISILNTFELFKLLQKYHPQAYYGLTDDFQIRITAVASAEDQAKIVSDMTFNFIQGCEFFQPYISRNTSLEMELRTPRDIDKYGSEGKGSILIRASPCNAGTVRGPGNIVAIMDEIAAFAENSATKSDDAVYEALLPSVSTFVNPEGKLDGRMIVISSPKGPSGTLYDLYELARGKTEASKEILMIKAPTWEMNPRVGSSVLISQYEKNKNSYDMEYGAEFRNRTESYIDDEVVLRQAIIPDLRPRPFGEFGIRYFMGVDVGLVHDGTSIVISHPDVQIEEFAPGEYRENQIITVDYFQVDYPGEGRCAGYKVLEVDMIVDWISELCKKFFIQKGCFDHYQGMAIQQGLAKKGFGQFETQQGTDSRHSHLYKTFYSLLTQGKIRLYNNEPKEFPDGEEQRNDNELITELLALRQTIRSKYRIKVEAPPGSHDDLSDALVRSVLLSYQSIEQGPSIIRGTSGSDKSFTMGSTGAGILSFQRKQAQLHGLNTQRPNMYTRRLSQRRRR